MARDIYIKNGSPLVRFVARVETGASPDDCWAWRGAHSTGGYGQVYIPERGVVYTHRLAYELFRGDVPQGLFVCHTCDNRGCCNPRHFFVGTNGDNIRDARDKGRLTGKNAERGEARYNAKLTDALVRLVRSRCDAGETQRAVAADLGLKVSLVSQAAGRRTWKHVVDVEVS
jgi:hypothetical protein